MLHISHRAHHPFYQGFVLDLAIRRCPLLSMSTDNRLSVSDGRLHYTLPGRPSAHVQRPDRSARQLVRKY